MALRLAIEAGCDNHARFQRVLVGRRLLLSSKSNDLVSIRFQGDWGPTLQWSKMLGYRATRPTRFEVARRGTFRRCHRSSQGTVRDTRSDERRSRLPSYLEGEHPPFWALTLEMRLAGWNWAIRFCQRESHHRQSHREALVSSALA